MSGCCHEEERRTRSLGYSLMNVECFAHLCEIAYHQGKDLWHFTTPGGRGIELALDYPLTYLTNPDKWSRQ